jgi:predicted RND superfamily exporter protein
MAVTALAGWSTLRTGSAVGTDANLGADHPAVREFNDFLERFGGGYPVVVAYECTDEAVCHGAFDRPALEMANAVSRRLSRTRYVSRVSSPANARLLVLNGDLGLDARQLVANGVVSDDPSLVARALADPLWSRTLVSTDGRVGAMIVELNSTGTTALSSVMEAIRETIRPYEQQGFDFHIAGEAVTTVSAHEAGIEGASRAGALTGGMLFMALLLMIRSLPGVLASLATIGVASAWTMGLLPVLGWRQSELTSGAATLILVIGCADCIHLVTAYLELLGRSGSAVDALRSAGRSILGPCFITMATTVAAFASFASGEVAAITQFGAMAAIGISIVFVLTFSLLPALLVLLRPKPRRLQYSVAWQEVLGRLARFGVRRRRLVLTASFFLAVVGLIGIPKLHIEMSVEALWGPDHPVRRQIDFVSRHLQRADRLEIELSLPPDTYLENPDTLRMVAALESDLISLQSVGQPQSLTTVLRHIHQVVSGKGFSSNGMPESESEIGELLFLASSGAPGMLDAWLTLDQRHTRISLEVDELSMKEKSRLLDEVEHLLRNRLPHGWTWRVTGPVVLTSFFSQAFSRSQTNIVSVSSVLVTAMIGIYLKSLPWALLAVIPNAIALIFMFGTMGHWGILLNFGSAIVAPIAIGIAADDTIHFLTAYSRERRSGKDAIASLHAAISSVGEAVIATALALALGFLSMLASPMASVADMGLLCAIAILGATLADLLILPALIATVSGWKLFERRASLHG